MVSCHLSTVRKQNIMKTHWETDTRVQPLVASLDEAKALGREPGGFHGACLMERSAGPLFYSSSYFVRIKCPSAAHTS